MHNMSEINKMSNNQYFQFKIKSKFAALIFLFINQILFNLKTL